MEFFFIYFANMFIIFYICDHFNKKKYRTKIKLLIYICLDGPFSATFQLYGLNTIQYNTIQYNKLYLKLERIKQL